MTAVQILDMSWDALIMVCAVIALVSACTWLGNRLEREQRDQVEYPWWAVWEPREDTDKEELD